MHNITLTLRQAIVQRMTNKSTEEIEGVIKDSIGAEERVLPGLGVLLEIIWQNADEQLQQSLVNTLHEHLPH